MYCILVVAVVVALCCRQNLLIRRLLCSVQVMPSSACFEKFTAYPVTECIRVGRHYGHPDYAMEKALHFNWTIKSLFMSFQEQYMTLLFRK